MTTIESRLNFTDYDPSSSSAIKLKAGEDESYYQDEFNRYCAENDIDNSEDECSAMIMADYGTATQIDTYWFWIDND